MAHLHNDCIFQLSLITAVEVRAIQAVKVPILGLGCLWLNQRARQAAQSCMMAAAIFCQEPHQQAVCSAVSSKPASQLPRAGSAHLEEPAPKI